MNGAKYIPLYRKYRPQTFYDLIGQDNIASALSNAIKLNRISHAYLFCGPRGTGKTSSARILAKSLNCKEGPALTPCGKCPACLDIMNSIPVDVIEIDAASNRSVEDTQAILEKIQYVPVNGRYKIYIIDEVHMLSNTAFNALLKTLEEPPENVIFILATTEPQKVLDTIISRCQRFDFRRITADDIVKRLEYISKEENINISKDALCTIAKNVQGGMRDALSLLDQISVLGVNKEITSDDVNELSGRISYDKLLKISECIAASDCTQAVRIIDEVYAKGNEPVQLLNNLIQYFRDLMIAKNCSDRELVFSLTRLNEENYEQHKAMADKFTASEIIQIIDKLSYYTAQTRDASDKYLRLELCIIELANYKNLPSVENLLKRIEALEAGVLPAPQTHSAARIRQDAPVSRPDTPVNPVLPKPQNAGIQKTDFEPKAEPPKQPARQSNMSVNQDIHNIWVSIVQSISSPIAKGYFQKAVPVELSENRILIAFPNDMFLKLADKNKKQSLSDAVSAYLGIKNPNIEIITTADIPKGLKPAAPVPPVKPEITEPEKTAEKPAEKPAVQNAVPAAIPAENTQPDTQEEEAGADNDIQNQEEAEYQSYIASQEKETPKQPEIRQEYSAESGQAAFVKELFNGRYIE